MKILFVNPGGNSAGGAERSLALLITGLRDRGHELAAVTLMEGNASDAFESAGACILANGVGAGLSSARCPGSLGGFVRGSLATVGEAANTAAALRNFARSFDADVIHTNGLRTHILTPLLGRDRRVVWSLREQPPGAPGRWLTRNAARFAAAVVTPSTSVAELVSRCRRPIYVIPNPIETPPALDSTSCRQKLGLPLDRPIAAVIAHLHPTKGHHVAVAAWKELDQPRPLLVLAGGDLYGQASVEYRRSLETDVAKTGLGQDITILGLVRDMASLYAACDLVVHPALSPEGTGRSVGEAQAAGVPVLATAVGGSLELIEDGVSGILVPPADAPAIAQEVGRVLHDSALRSVLREGGLAAGRRYGISAHAAAVESVYRAVSR